jgi:Ca2+-binding RTX toxin-like protein
MATIFGKPGSKDVLVGTNDDDQIHGLDGNDIIWAAGGDDVVYGGAGADLMYGGDGDDLLSYVSSNTAVIVSLASGTGSGGEAEGDVFAAFEDVLGSPYDDILIGDGGANALYGQFGNDILWGEGGDDKLYGDSGDDSLMGGSGADRLDGGLGNDTAAYDYSPAGVFVALMTGDASGGDAAGDVFFSIENLSGSGHADTLWGNNGANVLEGNAGNDSFKGFGGADTIDGGQGIDTASYDDSSTGVQVNLLLGKGHGGSAEGDKLKGIENLTGSGSADDLIGDGNVNTLVGGGGDDGLKGAGGADTLDGGKGIDTAEYGDSFEGVLVNLKNGQGHWGSAEGDTLKNVENLSGSAFDDSLWGNDESNMLKGGGGADNLYGGGSYDTLEGGMGADYLTGGAGGDSFVWKSINETDAYQSSAMDFISDFNWAQGDEINLLAIDANEAVDGVQEFDFIGSAEFSAPGQIRYFNIGNNTYIVLNTDDNPNDNEAAIHVAGLQTPNEVWFAHSGFV